MIPNLCRYDLVFPCPDTMAVNAGEIGKLACSLCSTDGRNDLHRAPLFVLSHSLCHFAVCVCGVYLQATRNSHRE
jgi:hypothetical protein